MPNSASRLPAKPAIPCRFHLLPANGPRMQPALEFREVSKTYRRWGGLKKVCALERVSWTVQQGTQWALLGPNRSGKSTLLKVLLSLCRPSAGRVYRFGRPASDRGTLADVGYVHDRQAFAPYLTARELLAFFGAAGGLTGREVASRGEQLLERVGLADRSREPIRTFSKGMLQRLALAQALLNDPALLVLDEPAEGLDLSGRHLLLEVLRERRLTGRTSILVSHGLHEVQSQCDFAAVLKSGKLVFRGALTELCDQGSGGAGGLEASLAHLYEAACP